MCEQRRGNLHERNTAQISCRHEPREIAHDAAAERDPHLASVNFQDVVGRGEALPRPYVYNTSVELDFAHLLLGNGYLAQGKLAEAQAAFAHAIESTDAYIAGATTGNMSIVDTRLGNYTQAIAGQIKRLAQTQANQDVRNAAIAALNLGQAYYNQANMAQSENYLREAQRLFAQTHDQIGQAMSAGNFGELLMELKRLDEAEPALQRALRMFRQVGYRHMVCSTLGSLGKLAVLRNQFEEAAPLLADCLSMGQAIGANDQLALCHQTLADIALAQGDLTTARASLCAALQAARDGGEHRYQQDCVLRLAQLDARENRHQQAQHGLATLKADADLPEDLRVEIEKLTQSLPNTSAPSTPLALDEWIAELLST